MAELSDTVQTADMQIIIDDEFKHLMPALDKHTYETLEASILKNGCRDALILWEGILIDGHNRYEICTKHGIGFETATMEFSSREDVLVWIINTQVGRRNLTPIQLMHFRGLHYRMERKLAGNPNMTDHQNALFAQNEQIGKTQTTAARLSDKYRASTCNIICHRLDYREHVPKIARHISQRQSPASEKSAAFIHRLARRPLLTDVNVCDPLPQ